MEFTQIQPDLTGIILLGISLILGIILLFSVIHILTNEFKDNSKKILWLLAIILSSGIIGVYYLFIKNKLIIKN